MRKSWFLVVGVLLVVALALAACTQASPLANTSWVLVELHGAGVLPDTTVTLVIGEKELGGRDGCNHYASSVTLRGGRFEVDPAIISTLIACEEPIMQQADAYLAALTLAESYRHEAGRLSLLSADGSVLAVFRAE